jgi:hypothetical protein
MAAKDLIEEIAAKGSDKEAIAYRLIARKSDLSVLIEGMKAKPVNVKFGCEKVLRIISQKRPERVYPHFLQIAEFLDSENKILTWGAILILANLAVVDRKHHFVSFFDRYYRPILGPDMIAAANVIGGSVKIARAYPHLVERIKTEILKVQKAKYKTPECRNVAIGHAIDSLEGFYDLIEDKRSVALFIKKQISNPRRTVAAKAAQFMRRPDVVAVL